MRFNIFQWFVDRRLAEAIELARRIVDQNNRILANQGKIMSAIDDLNAALTKISDAVNSAITAVGNNGANTAAIEAAAVQLTTLATNLQAALNPPAPPAPTP